MRLNNLVLARGPSVCTSTRSRCRWRRLASPSTMRDPAHGCGRDCGPHTVVRPTLHIGTEQPREHFTDVCETTAMPSSFVIPRGDLGDLEGPAVLARTPFDAAATFVQFALSAYPNVIQIIYMLANRSIVPYYFGESAAQNPAPLRRSGRTISSREHR